MKRLHLISGALLLAAFLLTGQYMDRYHNHMVGAPDGVRMLYRTRHIFILFSALLNLGIGVYFSSRIQAWRRALQWAGSALILLASLLFIGGFFYEPGLANLKTPLSHWGAYAILAGTLFHLFGSLGERGSALPTRS